MRAGRRKLPCFFLWQTSQVFKTCEVCHTLISPPLSFVYPNGSLAVLMQPGCNLFVIGVVLCMK